MINLEMRVDTVAPRERRADLRRTAPSSDNGGETANRPTFLVFSASIGFATSGDSVRLDLELILLAEFFPSKDDHNRATFKISRTGDTVC
jgi:hypothetical protein